MKRTSRELKRISRDILNNRYTVPMGAFITASLIPTVIEIPFSMSTGDYPTTAQYIIVGLAEFLIMLISQVLSTGVSRIHLNMTRGETYRLINLFDPFKSGADRFFGAALLFDLLSLLLCVPLILGAVCFYFSDITAISVTILLLTGVLSLILTIAFTLNYNFVFYFLLDYPQMKVRAAFKECRRLMKGNKKRFLYILFSFVGWSALILCSFGIAALWISPYMTQTLVTFYLDCTGELDRIPVRDYSKESKPFSKTFFD